MSHTLWRKYNGMSGRWTTTDPYGGSMTVADPQSFNRYSYVQNDPVNLVDPTGLMLSDIGVYQFDDPQDARIAEQQSLRDLQTSVNSDYASRHGGTAIYKGNHATFASARQASTALHEGVHTAVGGEGNVTVSATVNGVAQSEQPIEELVAVVIWSRPTRGLKGWNPVFAFGHVSYIIGDQMYSWEAHMGEDGQDDWLVKPVDEYVKGKQKDGSRGMAYVLDFGSREANEKFKNLALNAYNSFTAPDGKRWSYSITQNNCGDAFKRAINGMQLQGVPRENAIKPSSHEWYINNVLGTNYVRAQQRF